MVIDTSAILAILNGEPEAETFTDAILNDSTRLMSAGTALEISIVVRARKGQQAIKELDSFLSMAEIDIVNFDQNQLTIACYAFEHYGRGMNNSAKLNFGDCFAYALSKTSGEPLLFKGDDFSQTDITAVI